MTKQSAMQRKLRDYLWCKIREQLDSAHSLSWNVPEQAAKKRQHIGIAKQLRQLRRAS